MADLQRILLGTVLTAGALGGAPAGLAAPASVRGCSKSLALSYVRALNSAGHGQWDLALRNTSRSACSLRGFAAVHLQGPHGKVLRVRVTHSSRTPVRTVVLAPGKRAFFTVEFPAAGPCGRRVFTAYGVLVRVGSYNAGLELPVGGVRMCAPSLGGPPMVTAYRARLTLGGPGKTGAGPAR